MGNEIHKLVRAQLAANASHVRVRLERARALERTLPTASQTSRIRVAKEIRELSAQLEAWVTIMALSRIPGELREGDEADRCGVQFMGGGACVLPVGHWENEGTTHKLREGDKS